MALTQAQADAAVILLSTGDGTISLAGGAGLIVHGVTDRDTEDLDAFTRSTRTSTHELATRVRAAFERAAYTVVDGSASPEVSLRRLLVTPGGAHRGDPGHEPETVKIEIGQDYQALPAITTDLGPVLDPLELGANKILVIYSMTRPRDADDLARLCPRYPFDEMLNVADQKEVEPPDRQILADQMRLFARQPDSEFHWLTPEMAQAVKRFMVEAADCVAAGQPVDATLSPYAEQIPTPDVPARSPMQHLLDATQAPAARRQLGDPAASPTSPHRPYTSGTERGSHDLGPGR